MIISRVKGTRDFSPEEMRKWRYVENIIRKIFERYGYEEILTPTFEYLELFLKKSGDEIIQHAYVFEDKSGRKLILRPEETTPAIRFYVSGLRNRPHPLRLYYIVNCFRYEEPQAGRYREFWQAGVEIIGTNSPEAVAELIILANNVLEDLGLKNYEIRIGNIKLLKNILKEYDEKFQNKILRLIDKKEFDKLKSFKLKNEDELFRIINFKGDKNDLINICNDEDFINLLDYLDDASIKYKIDLSIARGLDYYSGIVFEIHSKKLGAQKQICGGGVYSLGELFGFDIKACGFAFGLDRLLLALEKENRLKNIGNEDKRFLIFIFDKKYFRKAIEIAKIVRRYFRCEIEIMRKKIKRALEYAINKNIDFLIILGEEIERDVILIKDLKRNIQKEIHINNLEDFLKNL